MHRHTRLPTFLVVLLSLAALVGSCHPDLEGRISKQDYRVYLAGAVFDPKTAPEPLPPASDSYYVVQFVRSLGREERQRLRDRYGLRLSEYVPNLAYLERLSPQTLDELSREELYRAEVPYAANYRISPSIGKSATTEEEVRVRLVLFPEGDGFNEDDLKAIVNAINLSWTTDFNTKSGDAREESGGPARAEGAAQLRVFDDTELGGQKQLVFSLPSAEPLAQLASLKGVRWIEEVKPVDPDAADQPPEAIPAGIIQSGTPNSTPVWDRGITGLGQVIGVTDGQPDLDHCQLRDTDGHPPGSSHRKVQGSRHVPEFDEVGNQVFDDHGMAVISIAAGRDATQKNPEKDLHKGVAYDARLSLDGRPDLSHGPSTLTQILDNQRLDGAFIHSNSWHVNDPSYNQITSAVDGFVWSNEQQLVCGSSGNDKETPGPPATSKNALSVSASRNYPDEMNAGDGAFSSLPSGMRKPEICAPGCNIHPANVTSAGDKCSAVLRDHCESSWATPAVAGAAALVRQYYVEGWYPAGQRAAAAARNFVSAALVKATLLNSTSDMTGVPGYPSAEEGWGLVKLANTLYFQGGRRKLFIDDVRNASGLHTGESRTYKISLQDSDEPLKITLCWSDPPPGVLGTGPALVNDLDLIVTAPGGQTFYGNNIDTSTGFSTIGGVRDNRNNVEMVIITKPATGEWKITVNGAATNVGESGQGFALVATASIS